VELLICNLDESQSYFKTEEENLEALMNMWIGKGPKQVIITNGKKGSIYYDGYQIGYQKAYVVKDENVVDVTGAGDAFSSAVIHSLINQEPLSRSVQYGAASAALTIQIEEAVNPKLSVNLIKKELKKYESI